MQWANSFDGEYFDDYDEARESVLENLKYIDDDYIWKIIKESYNPNEILKGLVDIKTGETLAEQIMNEITEHFLSDYLILIDDDEGE